MTLLRRLVAIVMIAITAVTFAAVPATAQEDDEDISSAAVIPVFGRGWGHGRGMGQYGTLGYALDEGWSSAQILNHFYGGTTAGTVSPGLMTVRLLSNDNKPTIVTVAGAQLATRAGDGATAKLVNGQAVKITLTGANTYQIASGPGCSGPWTVVETATSSSYVAVQPVLTGGSGPGGDPSQASFSYGPATAKPVVGDWNGDGIDTVGYRNGNVWYLRNSNSAGAADVTPFAFGAGADQPVVGDWDGDGIDTIGVRQGNTYLLRNSNSPGPVDISFPYGKSTDQAVVGDWDGDGDDTITVVRGTTWHINNSLDTTADNTLGFDPAADIPLGGDTDGLGDGDDRNGYDISAATFLLRDENNNGDADVDQAFGPAGATPVVGAWNGGGLDLVGTFLNGAWKLDLGLSSGAANGLTLIDANNPNLPLNHTLQLCEGGSDVTWYRGEIRASRFQLEQRTVSALSTEQYLRSVVPRESPASWADLGGGTGARALQVQAVAARSYSLAENRYQYAKTCDTISCQVYSGRQIRAGGTIFPGEDSRSDAAITATANVVRKNGSQVARTEFSSSTGGYTAGGVFPAVVDAGDDVSLNPNNQWSDSVTVAAIESYFGLSPFTGIGVVERNGLGPDGGRVTKVRVSFGSATAEISGTGFQAVFGLKSDWFSFDPAAPPPSPAVSTIFISNTLTTSVAQSQFEFGKPGDHVLVGDWNGDGVDTFLLRAGNAFRGSNSLSANTTEISFTFGKPTDDIFVGDWNGDGKDTLATRRQNVFRLSNTLGVESDELVIGYGKAGDDVFVGDWNGDGIDSFANRRGNVFFATNTLATGVADVVFGYGRAGDEVLVGDWDDNGADSFAVRRQNIFYVSNQLITTTAETEFGYGKAADQVFVGDWDADGVQTFAVRR
ncbi:MAG: hypothetical protein OEU32_04125 [Acidimicrobiia bacterium]|nr:hypothetical protein [Acidimicrobiia bacterium]